MSGGIYAFYAAHVPNTLNTIKSYSATFRMPFVTSGMAVNTSRQEVAYELYVRPQYSRALRDIIVKYAWSEIWYIYSNNEGRSVCVPTISLVLKITDAKFRNYVHASAAFWSQNINNIIAFHPPQSTRSSSVVTFVYLPVR